jgi:hypothetical protein
MANRIITIQLSEEDALILLGVLASIQTRTDDQKVVDDARDQLDQQLGGGRGQS